MHIGFWWESQKETDYYEDLDVDGRVELTEIGWGGMDGIDLAQDRSGGLL
jgi:hypothetical protein